MKRVAAILCILTALSSVSHGMSTLDAAHRGETPSGHEKAPVKTFHPLEIAGRIEEVTLAEPSKGMLPKLSLLGTDGREYTFLIRPTTTIYGPDWKAIPFNRLSRDQRVRVQFVTNRDGFLIGQSIRPDR